MKSILTEKAPQPIGPYSQAILAPAAGRLLFCSGQIPLDPTTGQVVGTDVKSQTAQVMKNIGAVLAEAGSDFKAIVKTTIFLKSMADFPEVNEVYGGFFQSDFPARSTVEVARLPKDVLVEIEVLAVLI